MGTLISSNALTDRAKDMPLPQATIRLRHPEWSQRNAHLVGGVRVSNPGAALLGVGQ